MSAIKKSDLVHVDHGKVFTDTLVIAENCKIGHETVIGHIRRHQSRFEELGQLRFQIGVKSKKGAGQKTEYAELNEDQATVLITMLRNTDIVLDFKFALVKAFRKAINELNRIKSEPDRTQAIKDKRSAGIYMTDSLRFVRDMMGKATSNHQYGNEHLFCNRALTGEWKQLDETSLKLARKPATPQPNCVVYGAGGVMFKRLIPNPKQADRKQMIDDFVAEYKIKRPRLQLVINHMDNKK